MKVILVDFCFERSFIKLIKGKKWKKFAKIIKISERKSKNFQINLFTFFHLFKLNNFVDLANQHKFASRISKFNLNMPIIVVKISENLKHNQNINFST